MDWGGKAGSRRASRTLVIPPFVGPVAFQLLGRSGMVNLLLLEAFGTTLPCMEGLAGVVRASTFEGAAVEYEVVLAGGRPVRASAATAKGERLFPPGAEVLVSFDPADVILIPQEDR